MLSVQSRAVLPGLYVGVEGMGLLLDIFSFKGSLHSIGHL